MIQPTRLLISVLLSSTALAAAQDPDVHALRSGYARHFSAAFEDYRAGRFESAVRGFELALEREPRNATCAAYLDLACAGAGRADDALAWRERATEWRRVVVPDEAASAGPEPLLSIGGWSTNPSASNDGRIVAMGSRAVHVWDGLTGELIALLEETPSDVLVTPRGDRVLVLTTDGELLVCDPDGRTLARIELEGMRRGSIAISRDGERALVTGPAPGRRTYSLDLSSDPPGVKTLGVQNAMPAVGLGGQRFAAVHQHGRLRIWDGDGRVVSSYGSIGTGPFWAGFAELESGAYLVVCSLSTGACQLYDAETGALDGSLPVAAGGGIASAVIAGDDELLVGKRDGSVDVWSIETREHLRSFRLPNGYTGSLCVSESARLFAAEGRRGVAVADVRTGRVVGTRPREDLYPRGITFAGERLVYPEYEGLSIYDPVANDTRSLDYPGVRQIAGVDLAQGALYVTDETGLVRWIDSRTARESGSFALARPPDDLRALSDDGSCLIVTDEGELMLLDLRSGEVTPVDVCEHSGCRVRLDRSPERTMLIAYARCGSISAWNEESLRAPPVRFHATQRAWRAFAHPRFVAVRSGSEVLVVGLDGALQGSFVTKGYTLRDVALHPSKTLLALACDDGYVRLVDWRDASVVGRYFHEEPLFGADICDVLFDSGGSRIFTATNGFDTVNCWQVDPPQKLWTHDYRGGGGSLILQLELAEADTVLLGSDGGWRTAILDVESGAPIVDVDEHRVMHLAHDGSGGVIVGGEFWFGRWRLDDWSLRYRMFFAAGGGRVTFDPSGRYAVEGEADTSVWLFLDGRAERLDRHAHELLDPLLVERSIETGQSPPIARVRSGR